MDKILERFLEPERWRIAIEKGVCKEISRTELIELTTEECRIQIASLMMQGKYKISPPRTALIPKDKPGEFRTVYINQPKDRIILSIVNDLLMEICPDMIHPSCKSYQKGIGCNRIVKEASKIIAECNSGFKSDLSKYFDSVPLRYIDKCFDDVEKRHGHSCVIDVLRDYYHSDWYFDTDGNLQNNFQSLKQGCAVASFLADAILYDIDKELTGICELYVRYSDDMLGFGTRSMEALDVLKRRLEEMGMSLNPKKVEILDRDHWFTFLGFSLMGKKISFSKNALYSLVNEIRKRTVKRKGISLTKALNSMNSYLYKGNGQFSWATRYLTTVNVKKDIDELNKFFMDCLRAVETGKRKIGGLGYSKLEKNGVILRGKGRNVRANRKKMPRIEGYNTVGCMQKALMTRRALFDAMTSNM